MTKFDKYSWSAQRRRERRADMIEDIGFIGFVVVIIALGIACIWKLFITLG